MGQLKAGVDFVIFEGKRYRAMPSVVGASCLGCGLGGEGGLCNAESGESIFDCASKDTIAVLDTKAGLRAYIATRARHKLGIEEEEDA